MFQIGYNSEENTVLCSLFKSYENRQRRKGQRVYKNLFSYINHVVTVDTIVTDLLSDKTLTDSLSDLTFLQSVYRVDFRLQVSKNTCFIAAVKLLCSCFKIAS